MSGRAEDYAPQCGNVHPLANVECQRERGHDGHHEHTTGVRLKWHDPIDKRQL